MTKYFRYLQIRQYNGLVLSDEQHQQRMTIFNTKADPQTRYIYNWVDFLWIMLDGRRIYFFGFGSTVPFAGIETDSSWKSIEHHELHRPTNGMFAQAGGGWQLATLAGGVILVVKFPIASMSFMAIQPTPP